MIVIIYRKIYSSIRHLLCLCLSGTKHSLFKENILRQDSNRVVKSRIKFKLVKNIYIRIMMCKITSISELIPFLNLVCFFLKNLLE